MSAVQGVERTDDRIVLLSLVLRMELPGGLVTRASNTASTIKRTPARYTMSKVPQRVRFDLDGDRYHLQAGIG